MRVPLSVTTSATYDDVLADLVEEKVASRLAAMDAGLWGPDAESEASIRLSWVGLPTSSRPLVAEIDAVRAGLWEEGVDKVILCGMGGSSLAPELISRSYGLPVQIVDSTNPHRVSAALHGDLATSVVVVSSKSGTTTETNCQRRAFVAAFRAAGLDPARRIVVVTDPGSQLEQIGREEGYRHVFLADPHVGGRYSALTAFGLVPTGLAGADVADLLDSAEEVRAQLAEDSPTNPGLLLGAAIAANPGRDKIILADNGSGMVGFADWAEQLIAESTGKQGRGVLPVAVTDTTAPEVAEQAPDVEVGLLAGEDAAPVQTGGKPTVSVTGSLGAQLLTWETATAVAGRLLGINPFDQPDVESAKAAARGLLADPPAPEPAAFTDDGIEVRATPDLLDGATSLDDAVTATLQQLGPDGYLAVMAYVDSHRDAALHDVRAALARRTGRPVTFGWGPRFLHSTGQYHKGGPPQGVFLQVTCTEATDVPVPGGDYTFGQLIAAQAAGDAHVLAEHGRPVLRLHVTDPATGVPRLRELLR